MTNILINLHKRAAGIDLRGQVAKFGLDPDVSQYLENVAADDGTVKDVGVTNRLYAGLKSIGLIDDTELLWFAEAGIKTRGATVAGTPITFLSKGYSLDPTPKDLTQTTELNQPYLGGNIAPNERLGIKTGRQLRRISSTPIMYDENDGWSFTITLEINSIQTNETSVFIYASSPITSFEVSSSGVLLIRIGVNGTTISSVDFKPFFGKYLNFTTIKEGSVLYFYLNGSYLVQYNVSWFSNISTKFQTIFSVNSARFFDGEVKYYRIQNGAMTAQQVADEHTLLRSIYPEIPSVQIGTQTWATSNLEMVATPMGNVIPEVQSAEDWANATNLYNAAIAGGDSVAVATRKAAMWCYYNNDPNIGAVYGKCYNKYAAKLILNDIVAYNTANPSAHWGWKVPTRAQLTTLSLQGGNASKVGGTDYWATANGTNSNGLTLLGSGYRKADGTFADLKVTTGLLCSDADFVRKVINADNTFDEAAITTEGFAIRLIKDE